MNNFDKITKQNTRRRRRKHEITSEFCDPSFTLGDCKERDKEGNQLTLLQMLMRPLQLIREAVISTEETSGRITRQMTDTQKAEEPGTASYVCMLTPHTFA